VLNNDLAPTILDLAAPGYADASFDGRSLVPILSGGSPIDWQSRAQFLIEYSRSEPEQEERPTYSALQGAGRLYVESYDGVYWSGDSPSIIGLELYDLVSDPYEKSSLLHYPEDARDPQLGAWLDLMKDCSGSACADMENTFVR
jgi:arylsulfatase A-like enzyme